MRETIGNGGCHRSGSEIISEICKIEFDENEKQFRENHVAMKTYKTLTVHG